GYTQEEWKLMQEVRKIMHADDLPLCATCVRVPVYVGHSASIHAEFSHPMTPEEARAILGESPGTKVLDDPSVSLYPHAWSVAGSDNVYIGRVRQDICDPRALMMWVVMDNLRKGGALNALQIAESLIANEWL
ncbi:MAG: aspartate-semialdehyde dehydrogenase, partial [Chloroflexi bacterium]|nr:aspartate-semialdehyde dehydrogenase [Chloroflexota bacterium]